MMMFIAFMIDQIQLMSCETFKKVMKKVGRRSYLVRKLIGQVQMAVFKDWHQFYGIITGAVKVKWEFVNTS